jgi:putative hydrolase of HD superfamily
MNRIAELILEACFLKHLPRSGYQYLGAGKESVAEHVYMTMIIAYVLARMVPDAALPPTGHHVPFSRLARGPCR